MKNFVVYRSSAGSGKTFTLVKEYLRLALYDEKKLDYNYRRILAITFTNKAAAEMKGRVIEALDAISKAGDKLPVMGLLLSEELGISPDDLKHRSSVVLGSILHHYSDFSIGTIDSFTHKIVKTFAHDLKLPVNFNVELDTKGFYDKVIAQLFSRIGEDEYIGGLLKDFVLGKAENNISWDPEKQIQEFSALLQKENSENYIQKLKTFGPDELEAFRKQFNDYTKHYRNYLKLEAEKALGLIEKSGLSDDDFKYKKSGPQSFFRKCLNASVTPEDARGSRITEAIAENKWAGAGASDASKILERIGPELSGIAAELVAFIIANHSYYSLCNLLAGQMYSLMLLKKIEEISLEQKQEDRLVFISEFNQRIFDIINNEPTPFIYERLGERYQHYLLDEFQDTSSLQWQNILPLIDNSLSNGWFNLVVGDGKQSIYRWRNANVRQFARLPAIENESGSIVINEREKNLQRNFAENVLDTNFRSSKTIIEFNNALFASLQEKILPPEIKSIYDGQLQKCVPGKPESGYVSVDVGKISRDEMDGSTCAKIREYIGSALSSGFSYGDICILARKNQQGNTIADFLAEQNIPVISSDSLLLKNNLEVNTLLCFLSYLVNQQDTISGAAVLNYLRANGRITGEQLHRALRDLSSGRSLFTILQGHEIRLDQNELSLGNLLDNCIRIITALELHKNAYHYLRFFLDEVNEFQVQKNANPSLFFDWWQSRSRTASMIVPEGSNAVRIMTIHASKGLEFPVVIVPYFNWAVYRAGDSWVDIRNEKVGLPVSVVNLSRKAGESGFEKELEKEQAEQLLDNLNLLYVAFTRAVDRLHILASQSASNRQKGVNEWIEEFAAAHCRKAGDDVYEAGERAAKQESRSKNAAAAFPLGKLDFETSGDVIRIKAAYLHNSAETEDSRQLGIALHQLLSHIETATDIDNAIQQALLEGIIRQEQGPGLSAMLQRLTSLEELRPLFAPGANCRIEAEIMTGDGRLLRPDRILLGDGTATLLDYKTGRRNDEKYARQLNSYEEALQQMGFKTVKKLLLYIDEMAIVEVK